MKHLESGNLHVVSCNKLTIFSWVMLVVKETLGFFQTLAIVSLAPNRMKNNNFWDCLGIFETEKLRRAIEGDLGTG